MDRAESVTTVPYSGRFWGVEFKALVDSSGGGQGIAKRAYIPKSISDVDC